MPSTESNLEETYTLQEEAPRISPGAIPQHPLVQTMRVHPAIPPPVLAVLILNQSTLPWEVRPVRKSSVWGGEIHAVSVDWIGMRPQFESLADRQLRYLVCALFNLHDWEDVKLLELSTDGVMVGVPPGYQYNDGSYAVPAFQNGYPYNRVSWWASDQSIRCTCALRTPLAEGHITEIQEVLTASTQNNLICLHKELFKLMLSRSMLVGRKEEETVQWTPRS